jgi:hypothetical protein
MEAVNHPSHYNTGKIEVIDFIEDQKLNFNTGNAVKYIARAGKKNPEKEQEDIEKAIWYLQRELNRFKTQQPGSCPKHSSGILIGHCYESCEGETALVTNIVIEDGQSVVLFDITRPGSTHYSECKRWDIEHFRAAFSKKVN